MEINLNDDHQVLEAVGALLDTVENRAMVLEYLHSYLVAHGDCDEPLSTSP